MATAAEIAAQVTTIASLSSNEQTLLYQWMNEGYAHACGETECNVGTFGPITLTSGTPDYTITAAPFSLSDVVKFKRLYATGGGVTNLPMSHIEVGHLLDRRYTTYNANYQGVPTKYATQGTNRLLLWPTPTASSTISGMYVKAPNTLVASSPSAGQETTPTAFGSELHYPVIANYALYRAFQYRGNSARAAEHLQLFEGALDTLRSRVNEFGGDEASPINVGRRRARSRYRDIF